MNGLSDVNNRHPPVSGGCQEQVAYVNNTRPFLGAGTYTASDNALRLKSSLAMRDYHSMSTSQTEPNTNSVATSPSVTVSLI